MLSSSFNIYAILKLTPVLSQTSEKMHLLRTFSSSTAKTSTVTLNFYVMILNSAFLKRKKKKNGEKIYVQFFGYFTELYGLSYNGSNSACPN